MSRLYIVTLLMMYWVTSFDGLGDSQAGIKISRRNINLRYADDTANGRKLRGTKEPFDEGERGE